MQNTLRSFVAVLALVLSGCAGLSVPGLTTDDYRASLAATGAVLVAPVDLGTLPIPRGGDSLIRLVVAVAGPELTQHTELKGCVFQTYPATVADTVTVVATATCLLRGVPVEETITLTLTPVVPAV